MPAVAAFLVLSAVAHPAPDCYEAAWKAQELPCPCTNDDRQNPSARVMEEVWHLPPAAAELAARAWALGFLPAASAAWLTVVRAAPDRYEPIAALATRGWGGPAERLVAAFESSASPLENAKKVLLGFGKQKVLGMQTPALYSWLINQGPRGMAVILDAGLETRELGVAAGLAGLARLEGLDPGAPLPSGLRTDWARATLVSALERSLSHLAVEIYRALDAGTRARLIADPGGGWDMRRALAVALATDGASDLARPLDRGAARPPRVGWPGQKFDVPCSDLNALALRDRGSPLTPAERFQLRVSVRKCLYRASELAAVHHHLPEDRRQLGGRLISLARDIEANRDDRLGLSAGIFEGPMRRVRGEAVREAARLRRLAGPSDDSVWDAFLSEAGTAAFARSSTAPFQEVAATLPPTANAVCPELPEDFDAVTARKSADGACFAVAMSHALDPTSMATGGGYWLLLQKDPKDIAWGGGKIYLGLRVFRPYRIISEGEISLGGGVLRLTARRHQIDEKSIRFPLGSKFADDGALLTLQVGLAELQRDTDRDGLPDLEEQRMFLDPRRADTDGDGIGDASDPFPNVSARGPVSPTADLLTAFFAPYVDESEPPPPPRAGTQLPRLASHEAHFVEGEPSAFVGVSVAKRTVVLRPEELRRAVLDLGAFYPEGIDVVVDPSGTRAFIWSGGGASNWVYQAKKVGGRWQLESLGGSMA